jgi:hypothetical protein
VYYTRISCWYVCMLLYGGGGVGVLRSISGWYVLIVLLVVGWYGVLHTYFFFYFCFLEVGGHVGCLFWSFVFMGPP